VKVRIKKPSSFKLEARAHKVHKSWKVKLCEKLFFGRRKWKVEMRQ
jgi:hypothetical protein